MPNVISLPNKKPSSLLTYASCFAWSVLMTAPTIRFVTGLGTYVDLLVGLVLFLCVLMHGLKRKINVFDFWFLSIILYFSAVVSVSAMLIGAPEATGKALMIVMSLLLLVISVYAFEKTPTLKMFFFSYVVLNAVFYILLFQKGFEAVYEMRLLFSFGVPISILTSVALWPGSSPTFKALLAVVSLALMYAGIMSGNRSVLVITLLALLIYSVRFQRSVLKTIFISVPVAISLLAMLFFFFEESKAIARILATAEVGLGRELIWATSIDGIIESFPFGAGLGQSFRYLPDTFFWSHNIILELLLELGIFSIPLILTIAVITVPVAFTRNKLQFFYFLVFFICLLNFMKSFSLADIRFLTLPLAMLILSVRQTFNRLPSE